MSNINEFRSFKEKHLREMLEKHRGLLDTRLLCKIYEALELRAREKEEKKKWPQNSKKPLK